jgi:hypothetical protein
MNHTLMVRHVSILIFSILGMFAGYAEEKPVLSKRGGIPSDKRWKEADVIAYLRLPRLASMEGKVGLSMDEISRRIESAQSLVGYQPAKNSNDLLRLRSTQIPVVSLELRGEERPTLHVSVYDYRSWNTVCDRLYEYIKSSFSLWNVIPEAYTVKETENEYDLIRTGGDVQKWHFNLKKLYVIAVDVVPAQENAKSEEKAIAEIDKVIRELVRVIADDTPAKQDGRIVDEKALLKCKRLTNRIFL